MATLATPFRRSHLGDFNIFDILDDSEDGAASKASTPIAPTLQQQQHSVLSEVAVNEVHGVARTSPDDLALQLETFHIQTPARINKTRGLKPRPTIDSSTFDFPAQEQDNTEVSAPELAEGQFINHSSRLPRMLLTMRSQTLRTKTSLPSV
jgi:hypothetical protein